MSSSGLTRLFRRGLGRRMLILLCLAGLLPVVVTASLAYVEVRRGAETEAYDDLRTSAKNLGVDVLNNLLLAANNAVALADKLSDHGQSAMEDHDYLLHSFEAVWVDTAHETIRLYGEDDVRMPALGRPSRPGYTGALLRVGAHGDDVVFVTQSTFAGDAARVVVLLDPVNIWMPSEGTPYDKDFCVFTNTFVELYCTHDEGEIVRRAFLDASATDVVWDLDDSPQMASSWQLFLTGVFNSAPLELVASQPRAEAMSSYADFRRVFLPAIVLVLALAVLLSLHVIRGSLDPLQRLTRGARAFASGNLWHRVEIDTKDEFQSVAAAFNAMAGRLGRQIATLEAMSDIDRQILTGNSFNELSADVLKQLRRITGVEIAAIVVSDETSPGGATVVASYLDKVHSERIALPAEIGRENSVSRVVEVGKLRQVQEPYRGFLEKQSQTHAAIVPIVSDKRTKALLIIANSSELDLDSGLTQTCNEIAGRFAVALSSVEREEELYRQANFDELTGLPNRQLLKQRLANMIRQVGVGGNAGALLYLDIDRFKEVNDVHGHSVGDVVLAQAAERIVSEVDESAMVSRLGGDEFVVVLPSVIGDELAKSTASRLIERLTEVFTVFGVNHFVGASIGIVMFPTDGESVETLLKNADAAMYRAKEAGRARYEFFNVELNAESQRKIELERALRSAIDNDELRIAYQPQLNLRQGRLAGAEALLRWKHPTHGFVSPAEFIPLAEESDLILELGQWVLEQTCRDLRRLLDEGLHPGSMSVNVSARQLRDSNIVHDVLSALHGHQIDPRTLHLEVTETAVAQNRDTAISVLSALRDAGVRIALDDFGTGYSSLSYLKNMPFDVIKIDKSFVDGIEEDESSDKICRTIISMANQLDKISVAEGVEVREQLDRLKEAGCDIAQGYLYGRPMEFDELLAFIRKQDGHTQRRRALEVAK